METELLTKLSTLITKAREKNETFFIGIDGLSGSGKTHLAKKIAKKFDIPVFHIEDLYPGWNGLTAGITEYQRILPLLKSGLAIQYISWDWEHNRKQNSQIKPQKLIIFEGVGACIGKAKDFLDYTIWLACKEEKRKQQALTRDGNQYRPYWNTWAKQEKQLLVANPDYLSDIDFKKLT
ncbi:MAG: hypothetical protein QM571_05305 [Micrococcaceae bacterium]